VAANTTRPFWFQLYVLRDREFVERLIERAKQAKCSALMLTLDLQVLAQRHKDLINGLSAPPKPTLANMLNLFTKPYWCWNMLHTGRREFRNIVGHVKGVEDMTSLSEWTTQQFDPTLSWKDVEWVKKRWGGKLILKGILDAEDARFGLAAGADAIVVSNHGGRQLDGAPSSISVLAEIVAAIDGRCEVMFDGGIRSGQDIAKALALGARGTLIGRSFLYALAAAGEAGVVRAVEIMRNELRVTLALTGTPTVAAAGPHMLRLAD
jgi:L-lactate dehydrogenase (cytochrome)